jgi:hypothetical protein
LTELNGLSPVPPDLFGFAKANNQHLLHLRARLESFQDEALKRHAEVFANALAEVSSKTLKLLVRHPEVSPQTQAAIQQILDGRAQTARTRGSASRLVNVWGYDEADETDETEKAARANAKHLLPLQEQLESLLDDALRKLAEAIDQAPSEALELLVRHRETGPQVQAAIQKALDGRGQTAKELAKGSFQYLISMGQGIGWRNKLAAKEWERRNLVAELSMQGEAIEALLKNEEAPRDPWMTGLPPENLKEIMKSTAWSLEQRAAAAKELSDQHRNDPTRMMNPKVLAVDSILGGLTKDASLSAKALQYIYTNSDDVHLLALRLSGEPDNERALTLDLALTEALEVLTQHSQVGDQAKAMMQEELNRRKQIAEEPAEAGIQLALR